MGQLYLNSEWHETPKMMCTNLKERFNLGIDYATILCSNRVAWYYSDVA